jgi:hypothetical protein
VAAQPRTHARTQRTDPNAVVLEGGVGGRPADEERRDRKCNRHLSGRTHLRQRAGGAQRRPTRTDSATAARCSGGRGARRARRRARWRQGGHPHSSLGRRSSRRRRCDYHAHLVAAGRSCGRRGCGRSGAAAAVCRHCASGSALRAKTAGGGAGRAVPRAPRQLRCAARVPARRSATDLCVRSNFAARGLKRESHQPRAYAAAWCRAARRGRASSWAGRGGCEGRHERA